MNDDPIGFCVMKAQEEASKGNNADSNSFVFPLVLIVMAIMLFFAFIEVYPTLK